MAGATEVLDPEPWNSQQVVVYFCQGHAGRQELSTMDWCWPQWEPQLDSFCTLRASSTLILKAAV